MTYEITPHKEPDPARLEIVTQQTHFVIFKTPLWILCSNGKGHLFVNV